MEEATLLQSDKLTWLLIRIVRVYWRRKSSVCGLSPPKRKQDREKLEQMDV